MALSLKTIINCRKNIDITSNITLYEKIDACVKMLANKIIEGSIDTATIPNPNGLTVDYVKWSIAALKGTVISYMIYSILDHESMTLGEMTDTNIETVILSKLCYYCTPTFTALY